MSSLFEALASTDPEVADVVRREIERQNTTIQLIASENFTSLAVLAAQGSVLTNKYSEGYPGKRYYGGDYVGDGPQEPARGRGRAPFGTHPPNRPPPPGAHPHTAADQALLRPRRQGVG